AMHFYERQRRRTGRKLARLRDGLGAGRGFDGPGARCGRSDQRDAHDPVHYSISRQPVRPGYYDADRLPGDVLRRSLDLRHRAGASRTRLHDRTQTSKPDHLMDSVDIKIEGGAELAKRLRGLTDRIMTNVLRGVVLAGARVIRDAARAAA